MSALPEGAATIVEPPGTSVDLLAMLGLGIATAGLGGLFFVTAGRRRRRAVVAAVEPVSAPMQGGARPALRHAAPSDPGDEENVPRWLRASVRAERFRTIDREVRSTTRLVPRRGTRFSEPPLEGATRMLVRYERVPVLEQPNEAYGRTLTEVGTNDEVDVLETQDAWALVRTPSGATGWLPTMTIYRPAAEVSEAGVDPATPAAPELGSETTPGSPKGRRRGR